MSQSKATSIYSCLATKSDGGAGGAGGREGGWCHKPCMQGHRASLQCTRLRIWASAVRLELREIVGVFLGKKRKKNMQRCYTGEEILMQ